MEEKTFEFLQYTRGHTIRIFIRFPKRKKEKDKGMEKGKMQKQFPRAKFLYITDCALRASSG
jgi:hypothetical protein